MVVDDASVVMIALVEQEGTEGGFMGVVKGPVELAADETIECGRRVEVLNGIALEFSVERLMTEVAARDMDAAEAQVIERILPGGGKGGGVGVTGDLENLRRVVRMQLVPLQRQPLKKVERHGIGQRRMCGDSVHGPGIVTAD
jgi:hypothetical protein